MRKNNILILGGYGGNNVGDDAQLAGTLKDLRRIIPGATLVVLTPHLIQTMRRHWPDSVSFAPRVSFFDFDDDAARYVRFELKENHDWLLERSDFIYKNAGFYKKSLPHNLSEKQLQLVKLIEEAKLVFYAGGGFFMGPTASRLWDGALVCKIAALFDTPVVMSGQNLGVWLNEENKKIAYDGFKDVKLIATRDKTFSKSELSNVGIFGDHVFHTHDDALYIDGARKEVVNYILRKRGLKPGEKYISLSFHLEDGIEFVIKTIRNYTKIPIIIVPTCPPDQIHQRSIYKKLQEQSFEDLYIVEKLHNHSEVKGLIAGAYACISTRHHPIIFALGGSVPCMSINTTKYFSSKNHGALDLCNVPEMSFDCIGMQFNEEKNWN